ncbi:flagellar motor switch protein FliN/FliY [Pseudaminobacter salicylatoxidans]|uniref:Flagellar motor switch protein FliN n=1 Tax=Pseudaminobacter salicylatoxidans TaxID=93369 RepID=A0A316C1V6_PSESE|nr:flagellar motor switch protein FliN [Pseudaminobacter salicylatoxidans]PWJ83670.1 flagellar motor switch protein FliN/FliY [Pseudaminobacter salicylatoxidans]
MNQTSAEQQADTAADIPEEQLNRAIEELRGALRDEAGKASDDSSRHERQATPNAAVVMNIPVEVQIVLGSTEMQVSELLALQQGSTVALNRRIGEPVDVVVNGRRIARGEITVLESDPSRFGIKLTEIITAAKPA